MNICCGVAYSPQSQKPIGVIVAYNVYFQTPDRRYTQKKKMRKPIEKTIVMVYVKPKYRKQGLGALLIKSMRNHLKTNDKIERSPLFGMKGKEYGERLFRSVALKQNYNFL